MPVLNTFRCGNLTAIYLKDEVTGRVELQLIPSHLEADRIEGREYLDDAAEIRSLPKSWGPFRAHFPDSLVHFKSVGDKYGNGFSGGRTMRHSGSLDTLAYDHQTVDQSSSALCVKTYLRVPSGLLFEHIMKWRKGDQAISVTTVCHNESSTPVTLEMLSSFSLGGITPFERSDASDRLIFHRFRSHWSAEARPVSESIEELHLERSWIGHAQMSERFGQTGSLPVRGYFPFAAIEDRKKKVTWAAQLATPGSWQMELYRRGDHLSLSGGLADREFGHWTRVLSPADSIESPEAILTVVEGDRDAACRNLTHWQRHSLKSLPAQERELPIVFNEWCTTWGKPTHDNLVALARQLQKTPIKYLVIDDGWTERPAGTTQHNGDWIVDKKKFPFGIKKTCAEIKKLGFIPGIWFEFETCTPGTRGYEETSHQLHRDGQVLEVGNRRFWDFRDPWVHQFLGDRVIEFLRKNGFGYLKVDYNDTIGIGCDSLNGSIGEGLREHLAGVQRFFDQLRKKIPDLVIENCASGGHRLEPSMLARSSMSSFSDAHETVEIPLIAANLHKLVLPQQSQVWAVLRKNDDAQRLYFSLSATFLGRMALSGDVSQLSPPQWAIVRKAMSLYRKVYPIIRDGTSVKLGKDQKSFRHPQGWQAVLMSSRRSILVVVHCFDGRFSREIELPLPNRNWRLSDRFGLKSSGAKICRGKLVLRDLEPFTGQVFVLAHD
jgi:alpha-galactosidase